MAFAARLPGDVPDDEPVAIPPDLEEALVAYDRVQEWNALDRRDQCHIVDLVNEADGDTRQDRIEITIRYVLATAS